ncbi:hypothetical protein [Brucella sp. 191011898]|uniref:hypothetical protein n=1 Tax=Brucella sp. 191011898 TaxID=2730447 RepID=UPI0015DEFE9A|nr:hypothetical protein [Brucella sp. 191011898]CAB4326590.1 hypothetical protein BCH_01936 [Brucella sp. 191011898]
MKAIVVKAFPGVPDGEVHVRDFKLRDVVEGKLASVAIAQGWAVPEGTDLPDDLNGFDASEADALQKISQAVEDARAKMDAEIEAIRQTVDKAQQAADVRIGEINVTVEDALKAASAEISAINQKVADARGAADNELAAIANELAAAKRQDKPKESAEAEKDSGSKAAAGEGGSKSGSKEK